MKFPALLQSIAALGDRFVPTEFHSDPELFRKSRLIVNFGIQGGIFGAVYAIFYFCIGHIWGGSIVLACTLAMLAVGLSGSRRQILLGNLHTLVMTCGFTALALVEGGVTGHAVSWLATVPISALVLTDRRSSMAWFILSIAATLFFSLLFAFHLAVPILYAEKWHSLVTACGYVSLTLFSGLLGFVIESGRRNAHRRMEHALKNLAAANEGLARLNQEKTDLLQVVAHDLKSPLQAILGHAGLIAEGYVTSEEEILSSANHVVLTSRRMNHLITDLLDINAIEEGRFSLTIETFDLNTIVAEAVSHHQFAADSKQITLSLLPVTSPLIVRAAISPTTQVLDNLISNAVKYSPKNTTVSISIQPDGSVEVRDHGPGLSDDDQKKLFRKFTKLSARPTGGESSTGLGLSIAKKITEAMGGKIGCRSEIGRGSTFFIQLPLAEARLG